MLFCACCAAAQVVSIPMELNSDGTITESISGTKWAVNSARTPLVVDGVKGSAIRFDGYSTYATVEIDSTALSTSQLTVSMWCAAESYPMMDYETDAEQFTVIAGNGSSDSSDRTNKGIAFVLGSRGTYKFIFWTSWRYECVAEGTLPLYQWNHLVATIDGTNKICKLYNNGEEVGSRTCGSTITEGVADFYIGKERTEVKEGSFNLNTFNGIIDNIEIYNGIETSVITETTDNDVDLTYPASYYSDDLLRPAFHGMPSAGWSNETHGAVYYNGRFHLFFQKNPNGPYMARLNWGHLVSDNLYKWEEEPTAIKPGEEYDIKGCWSGCVFTDETLTGGKPNIFYTGVDFSKAMISQASPLDDGLVDWQKSTSNPVISGAPSGLSDDFRDCFVFSNGGSYYMIVGTSKNSIGATTLHKYDTSTGTWSNDGSIFFQGTTAGICGTFWEMPNVTKIGDQWLFTVTPLETSEGVKCLYWVGQIGDDGTFSPSYSYATVPGRVEMTGSSRYGYGLLSPTIFEYDGKTLMLGIVPDKLDSEYNYNLGWAHTYSLPREISIDDDGNLVQCPYEGLKTMRGATTYTASQFTLNGEQSLSPVEGRKAEVSATFTIGSADMGFNLFKSGNNVVKVYYSPTGNGIIVDAQNCTRISNDSGYFNGLYESTLPTTLSAGDTLKLQVFIDHSILDIFVNDKWAESVRVFPTESDATGIEVFADGSTYVNSVEAYILDESGSDDSGVTTVSNDKAAITIKDGVITLGGIGSEALVSVYSIDGREVARQNLKSACDCLAIDGKGCYIIRVENGSHVTSTKVLLR